MNPGCGAMPTIECVAEDTSDVVQLLPLVGAPELGVPIRKNEKDQPGRRCDP